MGDQGPPEAVWRLLVCPHCAGQLEHSTAGARCTACNAEYPRSPHGQLDLRLRTPKRVSIEVSLGVEQPAQIPVRKLVPNPNADRSLSRVGTATGSVAPPALSWMLPERGNGEPVLDLGGGSEPLRPPVEAAGYTYVGLDYGDPGSELLGDGHALPFPDNTFAKVLTVGVVEFFQHPLVAAREAYRVLAPGGYYVGTASFLIPYRGCFYHHTHRGLVTDLEHAGFTIEELMAPTDWSSLDGISQMGLFPKMPARLARGMVRPLDWLSRLWWKVGSKVRPIESDADELVRKSSYFFFVASKPG